VEGIILLISIQKQLKEMFGKQVEVCTKRSEKYIGIITWISPDNTMAELKMADGQIKLLTDVNIKQIKSI
jgi:RNase P/RNase MRP subunit p29